MTWSGCRLVGSLQVLVCPRYINPLYPETSREPAGHGARGRPPFVFNGTLARYRKIGVSAQRLPAPAAKKRIHRNHSGAPADQYPSAPNGLRAPIMGLLVTASSSRPITGSSARAQGIRSGFGSSARAQGIVPGRVSHVPSSVPPLEPSPFRPLCEGQPTASP